MNITQRQVILGLFMFMTVGVLILFVEKLIAWNEPIYIASTGISVVVLGGLLFAYWRGWEYGRYIAVIFTTLLPALTVQDPFLTQHITLSILIPPILALILTEPSWVIGSATVLYIGMLISAGGQGVYADPVTIVLYTMIIGGMILARLV